MRNPKHSIASAAVSAVLLMTSGFLRTAGAEEEPLAIKVDVSGYASFETNQVVKGSWNLNSNDMAHYWSNQVFAGVGFKAVLDEKFDLIASVEGKMWYPYPGEVSGRPWHSRKFSIWLNQACGTYSFGDRENPFFSITGGYFIYKYNDEVRNLGEFMFRSLTYPGIIFNDFDFPASRLLGFRFGLNFLEGNVKNDFMVLGETEMWPFGDISLAYVGSFTAANIITVGAGVNFCRLFSVNSDYTTPENSRNLIIKQYDTTGGSPTIEYDSAYYTFKAIKLMGRATIDPKPLMGNFNKVLGKEDLKLYGEIGVIGLKDYSFWYDDIMERMPIMFGFNVPAFNILDLLSVEFEYYAFPLNTSFQTVQIDLMPLPTNGVSQYFLNPDENKANHWKWSVYLKKTIFSRIAFTLQFARDHFRGNYEDGYPNFNESTVRPGDWHWTAKFSAGL